MNTLLATVKEIDSVDSLNIVYFDFSNLTLNMMSLDLSDAIKIGSKVKLITNPTHIALAKEFSGELSYSNQIKAEIKEIDSGKLLSSIKLSVEEFVLESIITVESCHRMNLRVGDEVTAFINPSELSILEVL